MRHQTAISLRGMVLQPLDHAHAQTLIQPATPVAHLLAHAQDVGEQSLVEFLVPAQPGRARPLHEPFLAAEMHLRQPDETIQAGDRPAWSHRRQTGQRPGSLSDAAVLPV